VEVNYIYIYIYIYIWHVDPLLGANHEIGECTVAIARQRHANNRGMEFYTRSAKQQLNSNRGRCFLCGPCQDVISRTIGVLERWKQI
jgi:hypothetical protein